LLLRKRWRYLLSKRDHRISPDGRCPRDWGDDFG
jgi:hypothetical protein